MANTPHYLQDAKDLLTKDGFTANGVWYHGTSSALVDSILKTGLNKSGDAALKEASEKSMATIGHDFDSSNEPVFLTQSKELAYYWATQTERNRSVRFQGDEQPVVLEVNFPEEQRAKVNPDVGAAGLLVIGGEEMLEFLAGIYKANGFTLPEIDPRKADRMDYLKWLGMAYIDADIDSQYVSMVSE